MVEKTEHAGLWPSLYDPLRNIGARLADWLNPASEASGNDNSYEISMELPGVSEDDVELTIEDGVVTIRGEKKTQTEKKGDTWFFSERQYGAFRRSFRLPGDADETGASASMKDGVLHITVPKLAPKPARTGNRIEINRG
ncbi:Hsp20/alpha crystallin family protein [Arenibacterium sp. CAU 1754]